VSDQLGLRSHDDTHQRAARRTGPPDGHPVAPGVTHTRLATCVRAASGRTRDDVAAPVFQSVDRGRETRRARKCHIRRLAVPARQQSEIIGSIEGSAGPNEAIATHIGPLGESTARALRIAESRPDVQAQDWELQFLEISPLNVAAVWLRAARSVIIPLSPAPRWVRQEEPIGEDEFIRILQQPGARPFRLTDQTGRRSPNAGARSLQRPTSR
jgi:hypothetical protein